VARAETPTCAPPAIDEAADGDVSPLAALEAMDLLDHLAPEQLLQELVVRAADAFDVPIALVSLSIEGTNWFHAHVRREGWAELREASRASAFCEHVVLRGQPVAVVDARVHPAFAGHPLVLSGAALSFAGAPLGTLDGDVLGALCILDSQPASPSTARLDMLTRVATRFARDIEVRSKARGAAFEVVRLNDKLTVAQTSLVAANVRYRALEAALAALDDGLVLMNGQREILYVNEAARGVLGVDRESLGRLGGGEVARRLAGHVREAAPIPTRAHELAHAPPPFSTELYFEQPRARTVRWTAKTVALPSGSGELFVLRELRDREGEGNDWDRARQPDSSGLRSSRVVKKRSSR